MTVLNTPSFSTTLVLAYSRVRSRPAAANTTAILPRKSARPADQSGRRSNLRADLLACESLRRDLVAEVEHVRGPSGRAKWPSRRFSARINDKWLTTTTRRGRQPSTHRAFPSPAPAPPSCCRLDDRRRHTTRR